MAFTPGKKADEDANGWNAEWEGYVYEVHSRMREHPELRPDLSSSTFKVFESEGNISTTHLMRRDLCRSQEQLRGYVKSKGGVSGIRGRFEGIRISLRKGVLVGALAEVESFGVRYLIGKRILCPELVVHRLVPTRAFVGLLKSNLKSSEGITSTKEVDLFLGLPWNGGGGGAVFVEQSLISRSLYVLLFLLSVLHKVCGEQLSVPVFEGEKEEEEEEIGRCVAQLGAEAGAKFREYVSGCGWCGVVEGLMLCGGCRGVRYCSKACQRRDWKRHRSGCREIVS